MIVIGWGSIWALITGTVPHMFERTEQPVKTWVYATALVVGVTIVAFLSGLLLRLYVLVVIGAIRKYSLQSPPQCDFQG